MNLDWLKTLAPTIASALGGPLAGLAVSAISSAMGVAPDKVTDILQSGQMNGEQLVALKKAEMELKAKEDELGFKFTELEFKDRDSARAREATVKDNTNKILAYTIVGGFLLMVGATLLGYTEVETVLAGTLIGYLSAKCEQVLAYYFGSSKSSDRKTELLSQAPAVK